MGTTWFKESKYAWIGLGSLWIIGFIGALTRFSMAFFQVQISEDLQISRGFISMAWSTNLLITAICAPVGGWLAERYGTKKVLFISAAMSTLGTGVVTLGNHSSVFFIGYGVISGLAGIGATTSYILMFEWFRHHRAKAMALLGSASSVGLAIITPIFVSVGWLTWRNAFLASFALGILVTLPVIWLGVKSLQQKDMEKPHSDLSLETEEHDKPLTVKSSPKKFLHLPLFVVVAMALFTCGINMGSVEMNLVAIHQLANVTPSMIALSMSILGIMEITGAMICGYFLDRYNKLIMMSILYGIRIIGFVFLFMHLGSSPIVFAIAFGITYLSAVPGGILVINEFANGKGQHTGVLLFFHQGGGIVGALIGGLSFDYFRNYQNLIVVDIIICILVALGYFVLYTTHRRNLRIYNKKVTVSGL
ncbi:MFS transporter [Paenibacillus segetis]|uniref:Oxalate:formate antiporter n=1 Tax=Paenibacillus segetis TaxID=1325360 RepID=A0ABQ1Y523_9BACL|nr:MFS transporter [Paenibacillus segetis]GGH11692.1 putative oxalate:formate antiporter [Paenibacillus segetis]